MKKFLNLRKDLTQNGLIIFKSVIVFFFVVVVIAILFGWYKATAPHSQLITGMLESFFAISISISVSLFISALFATFQEFLVINEKQDTDRKQKFRAFFKCETQYGEDTGTRDYVTIILPSYSPDKKSMEHEDTQLAIKKQSDDLATIQEKDILISENRKGKLLNSIKIFRDQAAISFSQSDTIAAAKIVALFSKMNMRPPTIRTDLQGLCKFFQFDKNGNKINDKNAILKEIVDNLGPNADNNIETQLLDILNGIKPLGDRHYKTYISIGMFSNVFLMDLINNNVKGTFKKHFTCTTYRSESEAKRKIFIHRNKIDGDPLDEENPFDTKPVVLPEDKIKYDYALIARVNYNDKTIFICAGITVEGTKAAAAYFVNNWQKIQYKCPTDPFVIILNIDYKNWNSENISDKEPDYDFPKKRFSTLKDISPEELRKFKIP